MKIRNFFVSNSSSSSFIVIGCTELDHKDEYKDQVLVVDERFGHCTFGWENTEYSKMGDRIIFTYLQAVKPEWLSMLEDVMKEHLGVKEIVWNLCDSWYDSQNSDKSYAYIDHQSAACEGENLEMFENKEVLKQFLFCDLSSIHGGNDNEY